MLRIILCCSTGLILGSGACSAVTPPRSGPPFPSGEILWDRWGVPHVYGRNEDDLLYGFGWAQMHSHGDQILGLYARARGRAAEYWGEAELASDRRVHTLGIPGRAAEWYRAQSPAARRGLDAFVAGMNAYAHAHADQITDSVEVVLPVRPEDVLAHIQRVIHFEFVAGTAGIPWISQHWASQRGSNAWAVAPRRSASGNAMLLANPHLPWSGHFRLYEAHLVASGVNVYGATLVGFPFLGFGFNDHVAWTHTVNTIDGADLYELTFQGDGYRWNGGVRSFETEERTLLVRRDDGGLAEDVLMIRRSVHGPVLATIPGKALALRVAGLGEPGMVEQYWDMARATTLAEFERAVSRLQMPMFTVMYADRAGRIMSLFNGRVPDRPGGSWNDWGGVVPGDLPGTLWTGTLAYSRLPRVVDPASGWLQNANDPPWSTTLPYAVSPDTFPAYLAPPPGMGFRAQRSAGMLAADERISFEELVAYKQSTRVLLADRLLDDLLDAVRLHGGEPARNAARVLEQWDRSTDAESRGAVLFQAWFQELARRSGTGLAAVPWSADQPLSTPDGLADPTAAAAALDSAAVRVAAMYGSLDVPWGEVYRLRIGDIDLPASGGPESLGIFRVLEFGGDADGRFRAFAGDSYVAAIEFSEPVRAQVLIGYGNSSQPNSPHRADQIELFARKELRPAWRERADIERETTMRHRF